MEWIGIVKPPVILMNRASVLALLFTIIVFFTIDHPPSSASAGTYFPFYKYYLDFQNRLSNPSEVLKLQCFKNEGFAVNDKELDPVTIQHNQDWGFSFRTSLDGLKYHCVYQCLGLQGMFLAFQDNVDFEDQMCGGRHCTWMWNDDGVWLYHDRDRKYYQKIKFKHLV